MEATAKTRAKTEELVFQNPEQPVEPDTARALELRRKAQIERLALQNQADLAPDVARSLSDRKRETFRTVAEAIGLNFHDLAVRSGEIIAETNSKISDKLKERTSKWKDAYIDPVRAPILFPKPRPTDHSFWWARSYWSIAPGATAAFRDDGLHFYGGPTQHNHDAEMRTSFGATAYFALQPERFPTSPTGRFASNPHVELFGGIVAHGPNWDLLQGDGIASCELFLRQTIFQWKFGPEGPVAGTVAQAQPPDPWKLYLKNTGYSRHAALPGFKPIPPVTFGQADFNANEQLWAEIEVRFDIYLNSAGALVWCDPEVLLRTFQWPLLPA